MYFQDLYGCVRFGLAWYYMVLCSLEWYYMVFFVTLEVLCLLQFLAKRVKPSRKKLLPTELKREFFPNYHPQILKMFPPEKMSIGLVECKARRPHYTIGPPKRLIEGNLGKEGPQGSLHSQKLSIF